MHSETKHEEVVEESLSIANKEKELIIKALTKYLSNIEYQKSLK